MLLFPHRDLRPHLARFSLNIPLLCCFAGLLEVTALTAAAVRRRCVPLGGCRPTGGFKGLETGPEEFQPVLLQPITAEPLLLHSGRRPAAAHAPSYLCVLSACGSVSPSIPPAPPLPGSLTVLVPAGPTLLWTSFSPLGAPRAPSSSASVVTLLHLLAVCETETAGF